MMNYVDDQMAAYLPPTDSRFRKDIRAQEEGDIDEANA